MEKDSIAGLTQAQREVLRLWHVRKSAKEIGRALGITHWAVNERLRSARRVLGVATSSEAAERLAQTERGEGYKPLVYEPPALVGVAGHVLFSPQAEDGEPSSRASRLSAVREEQVPYGTGRPWLRLPLPRYRGDKNDLTIRTRLIWVGGIAFAAVAILGALITISSGVVHLVAQILRAHS